MQRLICTAALALVAMPAAAFEPTLGGTVGTLVLGPNHELYNATSGKHLDQPMTVSVGVRAGLALTDWFEVEGEAELGAWPVAGGTATLAGTRIGPRFIAPNLLGEGRHVHLTAGVGNLAVLAPNSLTGKDVDFAAHVGPGVAFDIGPHWAVRGDYRALVTSHVGESSVPSVQSLFTLGVGYRFGGEDPSQIDTDGDGVSDALDQCPDSRETVNGLSDEDGCADVLAEVGVYALDDAGQPVEGVTISVDGVLLGTTGADGGLALGPMPPGQLQVVAQHPEGKSIILTAEVGAQDVLLRPEFAAPLPEPVAVASEVHEELREIAEQILFTSGSTELSDDSNEHIERLAQVLLDTPGIEQVRVEGHTDDVGSASANLALSQARVDEVARRLVALGVPADRVTAEGFGESRPVADNSTPDGRAANRRVEIHAE